MEKNGQKVPETTHIVRGRIRITDVFRDERVQSVALIGGVLLGVVGSIADFAHSGNPQMLVVTGIGVALIFSSAWR